MCSVDGCDSGRRGVQRFNLPEDPESRLQWVQFLATVNKQRFRESSWKDISICLEHFTEDCFETVSPADQTGTVQLRTTPGNVPSLHHKLKTEEHEPQLVSPTCVLDPVETTEVACGRGSNEKNAITDLMREKAELLKMKGRFVVNAKRLLPLFNRTCPSCGGTVQLERVTYGALVVLNKQCIQCEYRDQWKSQVNASVPTTEDQQLTGGTGATPETQQVGPKVEIQNSTPGVSEIVPAINEESDAMDESEDLSDEGQKRRRRKKADSDEEWRPVWDRRPTLAPRQGPDVETEEEEEEDYYPPPVTKNGDLCTDCGMFFSKRWPHTCEHKIKPFSCNICGKRCVNEIALNTHSRVHDEGHEFRCKYCHATFKTKAHKLTHVETHRFEEQPYRCTDCTATFYSNKERSIHMEQHPRQTKCHICGMDFSKSTPLQRHLAVHTGMKPFKCQVCDRGFNQASHLKSHMRMHTGERPYKCQHCDKSFNHNVSLKSHVQRYHSSSPGSESKKEKIKERGSDTCNAEGDRSTRGPDSGLDDAETQQETEEEDQNERINVPNKKKRRSSGRPIGRPKTYNSDSKTGKPPGRKAKRVQAQGSSEDGEEEPSDNSAEKEEGSGRPATTERWWRRGAKHSDSDSDSEQEERKKKRYSSQTRDKRKGRGRQNQNLVV